MAEIEIENVEVIESGRVAQVVEPEPKYRGIKAMPFIMGNETFEKLGGVGLLANLALYLSSFFNMKRVTAISLLSIFNGTANFATLIGAYCSDSYFGRYKTIGFGSIASFLGFLVIALTAAIKKLHPPHCQSPEDIDKCIGPTSFQIGFLLTGFLFMIVGAAGIRPCSLAFGVDQFNPKTESGKGAINSFFNWYTFSFTFAQMVSLTLVVYIQSISWSIGLAIPAFFMLCATIFFFVGRKMYVIVKPEGSPMTSVAQVVVAAIKKRKLVMPESLYNHTPENSINCRLHYTEQFRCLDKAAIRSEEDGINQDGSPVDRWSLCTMQQVEETKCVVRILPIWGSLLVYHLAIQQQYALYQALQSDRHLGNSFQIPGASFNVFSMLSLSIFIPIYDRLIVPNLRKLTGKEEGITLLQRIGIGACLGVVSSLVSAFVEERRRTLVLTKPGLNSRDYASPMSALFLVPQLSIAGLSEAFAGIGQIEFYYKQLPENMRSFGGAFLFCNGAVSSYLYTLLIAVVHKTTEGASTGNWVPEDLNKGRLDYFYFLLAVIGSMNVFCFLLCAKWYRYKGEGVEGYNDKKPDNDVA